MVYYTNRRDRNYLLFPADDPNGAGSRGNGVWNATLTERRRWAQISLERSRLPRPSPTKYGHGSVTRLFDALKPPHGWLEVFTSQVQDEWFLLYATVVVWLTVIIAGFGSELVLGEQIVRRSAVNHEWTSVMWHAAQLAFSLCLTVALFAHSAIGLPFLVLMWLPTSLMSVLVTPHVLKKCVADPHSSRPKRRHTRETTPSLRHPPLPRPPRLEIKWKSTTITHNGRQPWLASAHTTPRCASQLRDRLLGRARAARRSR